jgi:hypothetical protein
MKLPPSAVTPTKREPLVVPPAKGRPRGVKDAVHYELKLGEEAARKEVALIMDGVRYGLFVDLDPPLPVNAYMQLRNVAMMERLFGFTEDEVTTRLACEPGIVASLRRHPHYQAVLDAVGESARQVGGIRTIDGAAEQAEGRVAKEMLLMAMTAGSREKTVALAAFADRRSPKRTRGDGETNVFVFPTNALELIQLGLARGRASVDPHQPPQVSLPGGELPTVVARLEPEDDDAIDGEVLNVPLARVVTPPKGV